MGSIQSLRSWALATRANEDTDVQISGFLGSVNKSLGKQIVDSISQLQNIVNERTKAYNSLVASINKTIDGKNGIAEKSILGAFAGMRAIYSIALMVFDGTSATSIVSTLGTVVSNGLNAAAVDASLKSAIYDYERMASQLGYVEVRDSLGTYFPPDYHSSGLVGGASRFLDMRDSLMPRYNRSAPTGTTTYQFHYPEGYIGSLRRN